MHTSGFSTPGKPFQGGLVPRSRSLAQDRPDQLRCRHRNTSRPARPSAQAPASFRLIFSLENAMPAPSSAPYPSLCIFPSTSRALADCFSVGARWGIRAATSRTPDSAGVRRSRERAPEAGPKRQDQTTRECGQGRVRPAIAGFHTGNPTSCLSCLHRPCRRSKLDLVAALA